MVFTDLIFLYAFLPVSWCLYRLVSLRRPANWFLALVSLLFYAWGSTQSLAVLVILILFNYFSGFAIQASSGKTRTGQTVFAVAVNLLILSFYKYSFPALLGLKTPPMPTGLSFYMFSSLSYLFNVYRKKNKAQTNLADFVVFTAFFAWVNMGPIENYGLMEPQLKKRKVTAACVNEGAVLFLQGLMRKVILADNFALVFQALSQDSTWLGNLLLGFSYFFQLYFDFSGYSKMARGIARMFGFSVPQNFDLPYTALSVQDFWRRWHISLTSWFREYVYIPLGGNRVSHSRWVMNLMCVWLLTGIWHGTGLTFLVWGLYQGCLILLERQYLNRLLNRLPLWLRHGYLILTQLVGWTLFAAPDFPTAAGRIGRYFFAGITGFADPAAWFWLKCGLILFAAGIFFSSSLPQRLSRNLSILLRRWYPVLAVAGWLMILGICTILLVSQTNRTFLYAAF